MKKFLAIILAGAMVLAMAGCSGGTSSESSSAAESSSQDSSVVEESSSATESSAVESTEPESTVSEQPEESSDAESSEAEPVAPAVMAEPMKSDLLTAALTSSLSLDETTAAKAAEDMLPLLMYTEGNPARIAKVIKKLQAGEEVTVAFLGGSITQGTGADNENCYAALTAKWIQAQYPDAKVNYVNAGIGATGSYIGVHRCDTQVLSYNPDLVFIDFSVNDTSDRNTLNEETYEGLIRKIWQYDTAPGIICIAMTQDNGTSVQSCHGEVTDKYSVPFVSYHDAMLNFLDTTDGVQWSDISGDNIHPNKPGHAILSAMLTTYLQYVTDNLAGIDDADPELPAPGTTGAKFEKAQLLTTDDAQPVSTGAFNKKEMTFGGFVNPWLCRTSDGTYPEDSALVLEVEAQNIGLLYGKLTKNAGVADIYIDDALVTTLDADFTGGWGNYVEFAEIKTFLTTDKHTIKIVPRGNEGVASAFYISGITIS